MVVAHEDYDFDLAIDHSKTLLYNYKTIAFFIFLFLFTKAIKNKYLQFKISNLT